MLTKQIIKDLLEARPFEPFRIQLVSGDGIDIFNPDTVATMSHAVYQTVHDGDWVYFPYDMVVKIQSLVTDFPAS